MNNVRKNTITITYIKKIKTFIEQYCMCHALWYFESKLPYVKYEEKIPNVKINNKMNSACASIYGHSCMRLFTD